MDKMEQTIRNLNQKVNDLQNQGNNTMGAQDLVTLMETSNSNLVGQLASQNKRARSQDRRPGDPKLWSHRLELHDDAHSILQKEYRKGWRKVNKNLELWWAQGIYPTEVEPNLRGPVYLEHLTPMTLNKKSLSWLHSFSKRLEPKTSP